MVTKEIGTLMINFKSGSYIVTNSRVHSDYKLKDKIINVFKPHEEPKKATLPIVFSVIIAAGLMGWFIISNFVISEVPLNFRYIFESPFSVLFVMTYLSILFVIVNFWIKVKLTTTLWILLSIAPLLLLTIKFGLNAAHCSLETTSRNDKKVSPSTKNK